MQDDDLNIGGDDLDDEDLDDDEVNLDDDWGLDAEEKND